jgi:hypothetical protein
VGSGMRMKQPSKRFKPFMRILRIGWKGLRLDVER